MDAVMPNHAKHLEARPPIKVRKLEFRIPENAPKYFFRGEPGVTAFAYALSAVFPPGERFFIDSVRHFKDRIDDPRLQREVREFAGQEAQHTKLHELYNAYAKRRGFRTDHLEKHATERIEKVKETVPPIARLAATAALEHFTALMAEQLLGNPQYRGDIHPDHVELWLWHAAEEAEHKAVAFDVFKAVGGTYMVRMRSYAITSVTFPLTTLLQTFYLMHKDGTLTDPKALYGLFKFLFLDPGLVPRVLPGWLDYIRPDFHPWDRDDRDLLERWKAEYAAIAG